MLVPEALRYQTYKTCTLALCRPDKTRQRRIWHKQSALCWSVPLTLTLSPEGRGDWPGTFLDFVISQSLPMAGSGVLYATTLIISTIISPTTELTSSSRPQVFNVSFTDRSK